MKKQLTDRQKTLRLAIFWALCFAVGIGAGMLILFVTRGDGWDPKAMLEAAAPAASAVLAGLYLIGNATVLSAGWLRVGDMRCAIDALDPDDEDAIDAIERKLNMPVIAASAMQIIDMAIYPVLLWLCLRNSVPQALANVVFAVDCVVFLAGLIVAFVISKRVIDLEKRLNPEKRGSLLDRSFARDWERSMDEGEKLIVYQAGYQAYKQASAACGVLWLVSIITQFLLDTGVFPILCVCAVWLVLTLSYYRTAVRLEGR